MTADDDAIPQRQVPSPQRICLDGINGAGDLPSAARPLHYPQQQTARHRSKERRPRIDDIVGAQSNIYRNTKYQNMGKPGDLAHRSSGIVVRHIGSHPPFAHT